MFCISLLLKLCYDFVRETSKLEIRCGGAHLQPQHLESRGRRICEFEPSLVYVANCRTARTTYQNLNILMLGFYGVYFL